MSQLAQIHPNVQFYSVTLTFFVQNWQSCFISVPPHPHPTPPNVFKVLCVDYFSLGKVPCRACNLSCCIHIWKGCAIFSYSPIWSPAAPVRCVCTGLHWCWEPELVVRMSAEKGVLVGAGSQAGGASCPCVVWWLGGGVLFWQPTLVFAEKRCRLTCFVHLRFPPFRSCDHANRAATVISRCTDVLVTEESEKRGPYISYLSQHSLGPAIASDV